MIRNACKAVGSISSTAFDVRFNPDIFSPGRWWGRAGGALWGHLGALMMVGLLAYLSNDICLVTSASHPLAQVSVLSFTGVRFPESCQEEVRDQKQLLKDAAAFLLSCQIPGLVRAGPQGWQGRGASRRGLLRALVPDL